MSGDSILDRRERIMILTGDANYSAKDILITKNRHPADSLTVIRYLTYSRSIAAPESTNKMDNIEIQLSSGKLSDLEDKIYNKINVFKNEYNSAPGELRVCIDSLLPLIEDYKTDETVEFLQSVTERIRSVNGMGHFHLPTSTERKITDRLRSSFDAVVELRIKEGNLQQRWHIYDTDETLE